jgi:hypothetical protein
MSLKPNSVRTTKLLIIKKFLACCVPFGVIVIFAQPLAVSAEVRAGAKCVKAGKVIDVAATKLVCAKSGKKLVWTIVSVTTTNTTAVAATTTSIAVTTTTVAAATTTTTTTTTVAADKRAPVVTLLRGVGSSTSSTLTFTVTGDEPITCSTLSKNFDEDFTWDKISLIGTIVQTSTTVCTITAFSTAERDNDDHIATLRASANFSITDTAGNAQKTLLGSPQSTTVRRA